MYIQMEERQVGNVTILDLSGRMTIDHGAELLKDSLATTRLATVFRTTDSEDDALRGFREESTTSRHA